MNIIDKLKPYAKAVVGFVAPGVALAVVAVQESSPGGSAITVPEWVGIIAACFTAGAAVYVAPNRPQFKTAASTDEVPDEDPEQDA